MRSVFLDTVGLLAVWDVRDQWHAEATRVFESLAGEKVRLFTSEFVLLECANATSRSPLRDLVTDTRDKLISRRCVLTATDEQYLEAWVEFRNGRAGQAGVIDLISFSLMRSYGIVEAFTNDQHFKTAGFVTLF